jgi:hypothetical protein
MDAVLLGPFEALLEIPVTGVECVGVKSNIDHDQPPVMLVSHL